MSNKIENMVVDGDLMVTGGIISNSLSNGLENLTGDTLSMWLVSQRFNGNVGFGLNGPSSEIFFFGWKSDSDSDFESKLSFHPDNKVVLTKSNGSTLNVTTSINYSMNRTTYSAVGPREFPATDFSYDIYKCDCTNGDIVISGKSSVGESRYGKEVYYIKTDDSPNKVILRCVENGGIVMSPSGMDIEIIEQYGMVKYRNI